MQMKDALGGSLLLTVQPMSQFLGQFLSPLKQFCIEVMGRGYKEKVRDRQKKKEKKKKGKKEGRRERRKGGKKERKGGRGRERVKREEVLSEAQPLCISIEDVIPDFSKSRHYPFLPLKCCCQHKV